MTRMMRLKQPKTWRALLGILLMNGMFLTPGYWTWAEPPPTIKKGPDVLSPEQRKQLQGPPIPPPAAPSSLGGQVRGGQFSSGCQDHRLITGRNDLFWQSNFTGSVRFDIERREATSQYLPPGPWIRKGHVFNATRYSDEAVNGRNLVLYHYRVRAFDQGGGGYSPYSNEISLVRDLQPARPSNFTATGVSAHQIDLRWRDNSNNEPGFAVWRCIGSRHNCDPGGGTWLEIAWLPPDSTGYSDTNLDPGRYYTYKVAAGRVSASDVVHWYPDCVGPIANTQVSFPADTRTYR